MKKLFSIILLAGLMSIIACGPSAEEKAAEEQRQADSIAAADASMRAAEEAAAAAAAAAALDTVHADTVKSATDTTARH